MPFGTSYAWRSVDVFEKGGDTLVLQQKMEVHESSTTGSTTIPQNEHRVVDPLTGSVINEFTFE